MVSSDHHFRYTFSLVPGTEWSEVAQLCVTLCDPMDCNLPVSSVRGIFQARIQEWVAISFSRGIFLTWGLNPGLPHCRQTLYPLSHRYRVDRDLCLHRMHSAEISMCRWDTSATSSKIIKLLIILRRPHDKSSLKN